MRITAKVFYLISLVSNLYILIFCFINPLSFHAELLKFTLLFSLFAIAMDCMALLCIKPGEKSTLVGILSILGSPLGAVFYLCWEDK